MTAKQMVELIGELSVNLKSVTDNNEELSEAERKYLYGLSSNGNIDNSLETSK